MSIARNRISKTLPLWLLLLLSAGCSAAPANLEDGAGSTQGRTLPTEPAGPACQSPAAGCPCPSDGTSIDCLGPKVQTGNYTTCTPGLRFCTGGTWGACMGKTSYQDVDTVTQDFASPCAAGTQIQWTNLTVQGLAPVGSRVDVSVQTADAVADLQTAPLTPAASFDDTMASPWSTVDVRAALATSGQSSGSWLRVTLGLVRASANAMSPSVSPPQLAWQCAPTP